MTYKEIIKKISQELGLTYKVVDRAYRSYWLFIRESIKSLPFKDIHNEEEFSKLRTHFNISSLGKLNATWNNYLGVQQRQNILKNRTKDAKNKEG